MVTDYIVYLLEDVSGEIPEPRVIAATFEEIKKFAVNYKENIVTEMEFNKEYNLGIGVCKHWHNVDTNTKY